MKKTRISVVCSAVVFALTMTACESTQLYSWHNYQEDYYHYVKNSDKDSLDKLMKTYEKIIKKQYELRGVVPPGIYADYGYLLLEAGKTEEAKKMLKKEIELYPESETFVSALLKRVES